MSLKAFHVFFILVSIVLCFGFGLWCLEAWQFEGLSKLYAVQGVASFVAGFGLMFYLRSVLQKLKHVSYL